MSNSKIRTQPDFSLNCQKHQEAINDKDFRAWQYNVQDHFKEKTVEEIKQELQETAFPFAICMENWRSEFNFSSLVRNANGFNAKEVFYLGDKKWDKRGATGTFNYTDVSFIQNMDELLKLKEKYVFVGMDNVSGSVPLTSYAWPKNALMIFGSEGTGLTPTMLGLCQDVVHIPMFGSVRSFNCASSSAMAMYDYISKVSNEPR